LTVKSFRSIFKLSFPSRPYSTLQPDLARRGIYEMGFPEGSNMKAPGEF
jgi:hypothetical protein